MLFCPIPLQFEPVKETSIYQYNTYLHPSAHIARVRGGSICLSNLSVDSPSLESGCISVLLCPRVYRIFAPVMCTMLSNLAGKAPWKF